MLVFLRLTAVLIWHGKADRNWQVKLDLQLLCIAKTGKAARTYQWIWPIGFSEVSLCNWGENIALQLEVGQPLSSCCARRNKIHVSLICILSFFFPTSNRNIFFFLKTRLAFIEVGTLSLRFYLGEMCPCSGDQRNMGKSFSKGINRIAMIKWPCLGIVWRGGFHPWGSRTAK